MSDVASSAVDPLTDVQVTPVTERSAPARTVTRRTVAVPTDDDARLHTVVDGPDSAHNTAPVTLVLAHGWTLAQAAWDDVAELLMPRVQDGRLRLVRYDQRGHGRSTWGRSAEVSIDLLGLDLAAVLDTVVPDGPVVLAGHSMGGMTIISLAAQRPELFGDRVRGVALVSTSAGDLAPEPRTRREWLQQKLTPGALSMALAGAQVLEKLRQKLPPENPRHQAFVRNLLYGADATDEMVLAGAEIMHASTVRAFAVFAPTFADHDKLQELAALDRVPVEILVGDADRLTPQRHSEKLAEALPEAQLHVVPRTGHMLPSERAGLVAEALDRLLTAAQVRR
jgi:pimeloyl-ACP methyl ester carboxylesterase